MRSVRHLVPLLVLLAAGLVAAGCDNPLGIPDNPAYAPTLTLYGKIKDRITGTGIGGARVSLKVAGRWITVASSGSTAATLADGSGGATRQVDTALGDWAMSDLPTTLVGAPFVVQTPVDASYVTAYDRINTRLSDSVGSSGNVSINHGDTLLDLGVTASVYVHDADNGQSVRRPDNAPLRIHRKDVAFSGFDEATAEQDATDPDLYTIVVPRQGHSNGNTETQLLIEPVDSDGDGFPDYQAGTAVITDFDKVQQGSPVVHVSLARFQPSGSTAIALVGSSADTIAGLGPFVIAENAIQLFFNQPVTPVDGPVVTLTYTDDLRGILQADPIPTVTLTAGNAGLASVATSLGGTLLTISPAAALAENETYSVKGRLQGYPPVSGSPPAQQPYDVVEADLSDAGLFPTFEVTFRQSTGITEPSERISADNLNSCTNNGQINPFAGACAAGQVRLMFPERVGGRVTLLSTRTGSTTTTVANPTPANVTCAMAYYPREGAGSTTTRGTLGSNYGAAACLVTLAGTSQPDETNATASRVTVALDVWDADGHSIHEIRTLVVE